MAKATDVAQTAPIDVFHEMFSAATAWEETANRTLEFAAVLLAVSRCEPLGDEYRNRMMDGLTYFAECLARDGLQASERMHSTIVQARHSVPSPAREMQRQAEKAMCG